MLTKTYFRRKLAQACGLGLVLSAAVACAPQQNVLTKEEVADGWQLLFDGKTLDQWKDYNGEELTMPWHVVDGCIQAKATAATWLATSLRRNSTKTSSSTGTGNSPTEGTAV